MMLFMGALRHMMRIARWFCALLGCELENSRYTSQDRTQNFAHFNIHIVVPSLQFSQAHSVQCLVLFCANASDRHRRLQSTCAGRESQPTYCKRYNYPRCLKKNLQQRQPCTSHCMELHLDMEKSLVCCATVNHHCRHAIRLIDDIDFSTLLFLLRPYHDQARRPDPSIRLLSDVRITPMLGCRLSLYPQDHLRITTVRRRLLPHSFSSDLLMSESLAFSIRCNRTLRANRCRSRS
jgi:hypothetical protein